MKHILLFIAGLLLFSLTSCNKNNLDSDDYLIFGHFYGECFGEGCVETFKLTDDNLYEDLLSQYSGNEFDFAELSDEKFELVDDLMDYFPEDLLDETEERIGCPDCYDQGGIFIQLSNDDGIRKWRIDNQKNDIPEYLHEFMDKVKVKIALING